MIVFDLACANGHRFEAWFGSSRSFAEQADRGLVSCPECGNTAVTKAPMAPAVAPKGNARSNPAEGRDRINAVSPEVANAMKALAAAQREALKNSTWVGSSFADVSRAMHYGERDHATIHGQATPQEAQALHDEGVPVLPLPFPVTPPHKLN
ncbi:DUF1178 family protein [Altererythrobacter aerius]|uniref:DUF1178 family protein n=1 Tax=Tsuneonella aeria TaxID=1837929 RepID=A0A6I4TBP7_9SPHN|nr:DUF1178 family protein [Tsuneonella aeria]MXO74087.1 DUF1178 family protein [Tsuneonella aeria]